MNTGTPQQIKAEYSRALQLAKSGNLRDAAARLDALSLKHPQTPEFRSSAPGSPPRWGMSPTWCRTIDRAYALRPTEPAILDEAIAAHRGAGNTDRVLDLFDARIALDRSAIAPQADKALYLQQIGQFDASEKLFRRPAQEAPERGRTVPHVRRHDSLQTGGPADRGNASAGQTSKAVGTGPHAYPLRTRQGDGRHRQSDKVFPHLHRANAEQGRALAR